MKRLRWLLAAAFGVLLSANLTACTSPSCSDYMELLQTCRDRVISEYSSPLKREGKEGGTISCKKDNVIKDCGVGNFCVRPPGRALSICYTGGTVYPAYRSLVDVLSSQCDSIFAARQAQGKGYFQCLKEANCDVKKIAACKAFLKKEKLSKMGQFWVGFAIFLVLALLLDGLLLFLVIKLVDRNNPKNTVVRGLILGAIMAVISYPLIYISPLIGIIISSSIYFGLIVAMFYQEMALTAFFTALHVLWAGIFFNFMVATGQLGNKIWLYQATKLRIALQEKHDRLSDELREYLRKEKAEKKKKSAKNKEEKSENKKDKK